MLDTKRSPECSAAIQHTNRIRKLQIQKDLEADLSGRVYRDEKVRELHRLND